MDVVLDLPTKRADPYDPACEEIGVALRAIWILYRRGKWNLLESLGLSRRENEERFRQFDSDHIRSDHGLLVTEKQTIRFLRANRHVLVAAIEMVGTYQKLYAKARGLRLREMEFLLTVFSGGDDE